MVTTKELEYYLHRNIPISQAIGVRVETASLQKVILSAPFLNNINHKKTVFGGSLHAVATLSCWSLIHIHLKQLPTFDIVITTSSIQYLHPVTSDFQTICELSDEGKWQRFISALSLKEKGRISLQAKIFQNDILAVAYEGTFAAIKRK